ncbi:hypothetical protein D3C72_1741770 [compost metagenome]
MSPLWVRPGSRKCTWSSIMPGSSQRPAASTTSLPSRGVSPVPICAMRPFSMRRSPSKVRPSLTRRALVMSVEDMSVFSCATARRGVGRFGHWIEAAGMERMAAAQPSRRQPAAAQRAVPGDGVHGVFRAARHETAARPQQRADEALVEAQQGDEQARDHSVILSQLA